MQSVNKPLNSQEQVIDLKAYWAVVMNAKWKILGFSLLITILVAIFVTGITPIYRATGSLLIKTSTDNTISIDSVLPLDTSRQDYFLTQFEILKSRSVSEQVIDKLNLANNKEFMPDDNEVSLINELTKYVKSYLPAEFNVEEKQQPLEARSEKVLLIDAFQSKLTITPIRNTQLVEISFEAKDPKLAALIANTVADVYINQEVLGQSTSTKKAADWLEVRLEELRVNLEDSINALDDYRVKENLIDLNAAGVLSIASDELESLTESYLRAKQTRFEAETLYLFVSNANGNDINYLMSIPEISEHPLITNVKNIENQAQQRVSELSFRYGAKHPKLVAAKAQLESIQEELKQQANKIVRGFAKELQAAKNNERRFIRELEQEKRKYQDISSTEQEYLRLQREVEANQSLYDTFLTRYKETEVTSDLDVEQAKILDQAETPLAPIKPNKKLLVILAFIASFAFAVIYAFVIDALNDTFRTAAEIESKLGLRLLGLLPLIKLKRKQTLSPHAFFDDKHKAFSEAVRTLRTGFMLSHIDDQHKVVLVTSSIPGEGKTTTSINIALSMSQVEKTLLIEADMRRPSFLGVFKLGADQAGLSNLISGTEKLENVIVHDEASGLDILPSGFIPSNPLELLSGAKFDAAMTILKQKYDRIVIDSPPTLAVSDALVLSKRADSVIYIVQSDSTKQAAVKKGISRLMQVNSHIDGIVLNRVDIKKGDKEDYEGYYGYGQ
ncbi:chain-length determining protein [Psychromonas sp. B3M02]|uniref:GumC family protein n=1 Tax=Psychromonas sp. B3M02 TaxID=2267226 RepID=UPI000DE8BBA0|nr:polysaccharide biosynthesis tyrosine autokinase [Psychromonas sp. B3M02]RBW46775.1 chain-length determining protein [Psychromonas sp. B3M02]